MKFTYRWGQRPLEGFTIKRGLGQGGFGEVYFGVSDGGKEVALKLLLRGRTETELRGISNCLNFKHPNLVHLYDLLTDERGDHWLVMEYVQGESLSAVLSRHPQGLPVDQARGWFLQVAKAVAFLHDHAVIHRDIKPGNVFIEHGLPKLGDYGLSKTVGASQLNQSANVGTVYYMAPEVAKGACTKQVDVYACGVMLYEMLTGELPFRGDSWAEVALRHQTDAPELARVPADYLPILAKALTKKPEQRYADMGEMIAAVEAIGRPTASFASPPPVPMARIVPEAKVAAKTPAEPPPLPKRDAAAKPSSAAYAVVPSARERIGELSGSLAAAPIAATVVVAAWALFSAIFEGRVDWYNLMPLYALTVGLTWAVLVPSKLRERRKRGAGFWAMLTLGAAIGFGAFWLDGWSLPMIVPDSAAAPPENEAYFAGAVRALPGSVEHLIGYVAFFAAALGLKNWSGYASRRRKERFSLGPVFGAGIFAFILWLVWLIFMQDNLPAYMMVALAGTAGVVQMVSPWTPPPPPQPKRRRLAYA